MRIVGLLKVNKCNNRYSLYLYIYIVIDSLEQLVIQEQDQHLDAMGGTLINLKEIAGTMNREIDDHVM
jgi:hypothetical protein